MQKIGCCRGVVVHIQATYLLLGILELADSGVNVECADCLHRLLLGRQRLAELRGCVWQTWSRTRPAGIPM